MIPSRLRPLATAPALLLIAVAITFAVLWRGVLFGHQGLIGGDILNNIPPWTAGTPPMHARNDLVSDPVTQFVPWLTSVRQQWLAGHIPLWNPDAFAGAPLLANDQSAVFSPFTLVALPFAPARGYSLAMLFKLVVAGVGMGVFLRQLRVGYTAAIVAGIAYASSSFMVDWLGHPQSAVAAIFPWAFASVELWLQTRRRLALLGLAAAVALQFLAGHAETTLHLGLMLAFYVAVRALVLERWRWQAIAGVAAAAALGTALAGVQLVPFLTELGNSTLVSDRSATGVGFGHLLAGELISWILPNGLGNPGIDNLPGPAPNYLEATGFIGVGALVLGGLGIVHSLKTRRSVGFALGISVVLAAGVVYGPLSQVAGRLPLLSSSSNARMIVMICFGMAAFAGLGVEAVLRMRPRWSAGRAASAGWALLGVGATALVGVVVLGLMLAAQGKAVDGLLPQWHGNVGFWVLEAGLSLLAVLCFLAAAALGRGGSGAAAGLACLVLAEGAIFAGPLQPRVPLANDPPPSATMTWLQEHRADGAVAGRALAMIPNLATEYGVRDVRGVDVTIDPRVRLYWSHADPGYDDRTFYTQLDRPGPAWLAAAGVRYYVSAPADVPAGATPVIQNPGFTLSSVAGTRPFAFSAAAVVAAAGADDAVSKLAADPLGPVVVESAGVGQPAAHADVSLTRQDAGAVDLDVSATAPATVVVLQSYTPDWKAQVDGAATPVRAADVLFQSFTVPAGHHLVTLRYQPASVTFGLIASALGIVGLAALFAVPFALARRRTPRRGAGSGSG
ncbi:MAG: hypothetical protein DLM65_07925 [Candidatus Aeolococcus gillhamiae]|uniref:YfhO family protein n=1 Tax=Candidatus Aeolococcus gillhamiae TaxID=3127015 RepID=A0A2W6AAC9_9BACT|nr:MAG: hypothetical protein DLM65_07925 [Candidatus Dormibacter sp. RRmetagenome_bin12]